MYFLRLLFGLNAILSALAISPVVVTRNQLRPNASSILANANARFSSQNTPLINYSDEFFTCPVTIGNGQVFNLDLDTGSSDTWIRGQNCVSTDGSCGQVGQLFVNVSDITIVDQLQSFQDSYGSGNLNGEIYKGRVAIGSVGATYNFGVSTAETGFAGQSDGLLGLAYSSLNSISGGNFVQSANVTKFGFYMSNSRNGKSGELTLNGYDATRFKEPIEYVLITSRTYFQFDFSGTFNVGKVTGKLSGAAIADTGTSLTILDTDVSNAINKAIGAVYDASQETFLINCNVLTTGPNVVLVFGGKSFLISPVEYVMDAGDGTCMSGIAGGAESMGTSILGDTFIRAYYTIFDIEHGRVGFAKAIHF